MPTLADAEAHQQALADLTTLAQAEFVATWRTVDLANPDEAAEAARDTLPVIAVAYTLASSTLAADFYEDLRDAAGVAGSFVAELADGPDLDRVDALLGWGLAPLYPSDPTIATPNPDKALSRLSGGLQRVVANSDRDTIAGNAARDPAKARWARHASANACAFCALLATRDAAYRSEEAALRVVSRRARRKRGEKYHDWCRCAAIPVWPDAPLERAPYVDDWQAAYDAATDELGGMNAPKAILAHMRQSLGTN